MKIESQSTKLNASGLAISESWSRRSAAAGVSFRKVCEEAEAILYKEGVFHIKEGSLYAMANVWRFQPPAALLLLHELYLRIRLHLAPPASVAKAYEILCESVGSVNFSRPLPAVRYYLAIEQSLLWAEEEARA